MTKNLNRIPDLTAEIVSKYPQIKYLEGGHRLFMKDIYL